MDPLLTQIAANLPFAAVFAYIAKQLYTDWKADRATAAQERGIQSERLLSIEATLVSIDRTLIESGFTMAKPPTVASMVETRNTDSPKPY